MASRREEPFGHVHRRRVAEASVSQHPDVPHTIAVQIRVFEVQQIQNGCAILLVNDDDFRLHKIVAGIKALSP